MLNRGPKRQGAVSVPLHVSLLMDIWVSPHHGSQVQEQIFQETGSGSCQSLNRLRPETGSISSVSAWLYPQVLLPPFFLINVTPSVRFLSFPSSELGSPCSFSKHSTIYYSKEKPSFLPTTDVSSTNRSVFVYHIVAVPETYQVSNKGLLDE